MARSTCRIRYRTSPTAIISSISQGGSFFNNKTYDEKKELFSSDYQLLTSTEYNTDGSHIISGGQSGVTLNSLHNDVMSGGGGWNETFSFKPQPGQELITDFNVGGAGHDVISLSSTLFANVAAVLAHTQTVGNDAVITLSRNNTITVENVTAATLNAHPSDFRLHA